MGALPPVHWVATLVGGSSPVTALQGHLEAELTEFGASPPSPASGALAGQHTVRTQSLRPQLGNCVLTHHLSMQIGMWSSSLQGGWLQAQGVSFWVNLASTFREVWVLGKGV